jgi:hypothetical protein
MRSGYKVGAPGAAVVDSHGMLSMGDHHRRNSQIFVGLSYVAELCGSNWQRSGHLIRSLVEDEQLALRHFVCVKSMHACPAAFNCQTGPEE